MEQLGMPQELAALDLLDGVGVVGIAVLVIFAYVRGWVVTPRELKAITKDRDTWKAAADTKDQQLAEKDTQLGHLAEVGKTVEQLARGLQQRMRP